MSGFGSGFGSSPPPSGGGFGGFGQAPAPSVFGAPPAPASGGFPSSPFGGGGGGGGFGNAAAPTSFAAPASFAGGSNSMNTSGFGSNNMGSPPPAFGAPSSGGGFGAPSPGGFGQPGGFGNNNNNNASGFGSPFGSSPQNNNQAQPMDVPNPFGSSPSGGGGAPPAVSFGMSSNVVMNPAPAPSSAGGMTFGAPASSGGFGSAAPFGNAPPASSGGFGSAPASSGPFGGGGGGMTFAPPASAASAQHHRSNSVEMSGSDSPTPMSAFGSPFHSTNNAGMDGSNTGSLSPIPEDTMGDAFSSSHNNSNDMGMSSPRGGGGGGDGNTNNNDGHDETGKDKLAELKAKKDKLAELKAKKKKLEEKKKKKEAAEQGGGGDGGDRKQQRNRDRDRDNRDRDRNRSRSSSPVPPDGDGGGLDSEQQARAERNAHRFAQNTNAATQAHMPTELKGRTSEKPSVTSAVGGDANREDLANAKSLVGTCEFMCPDEELLRRERESDIQLLEIPDPGGIHPNGWTLRNTAVKRFRRSAADYKLDVPEWVRPPDVLEGVCAYLEEWVMERDRQGPDRRFPQNGTPNSMDVYQFIWDRTRMIRKDFILQNYVGTGGACDARAVRCHERIARWHAMCEHQLSHINDFVVMQSQQNIQELGQAMKTLNQYYDDSMGRATVEVPDDEGRETRKNTGGFSHGCKSDCCQGGNPMDYDGSPLNNTADVSSLPSQRLIGKGMVSSPTRGTAEPEMRGLYILLTMNNDGGMEVMRYSAALYRERPEIYNSKPVQLALDIFKAKKDYNYVRFFRILRDPNTPYLFACLMFKHVEFLRKIAFRIMCKTYGAKKNGEPIYDAYPLKRLANVLCFEDMDEARAACKHYNITTKEVKVRSSSSGQTGVTEVVFWRHSDFKEPKDPEKGTVLPLRPKKMLRYIESKLKGATRLGVCRGEVSGDGASLSQLPPSRIPQMAPSAPAQLQSASVAAQPAVAESSALFGAPSPTFGAPSPTPDAEVDSANDLLQAQQEILRKQKEEEDKKREMEKKRKEEERQKAEQLRLAQEEQKRLERQKRKEEERKRREEEKKRIEMERKRIAEEKRIQAQKEKEERERAEAAAKEAARLKEEEERRRKLEEEARLKAEAEAREKERVERLRQEEERRQREIQAEKERQMLAEQERIRQEEERKRLEALKAQEEERKRKEAIARKEAQELEERVDKARKLLLLRRFRQRLPRRFLSRASTEESVKRIDPTFCLASPVSGDAIERELTVAKRASHTRTVSEILDYRKILNRILSKETLPLDVASMMLTVLSKDDDLMDRVRSKKYRSKESGPVRATLLFKVAVILPDPEGLEERSTYESIHTWLNRRLEYGKIDTMQRGDPMGAPLTAEVRVLFVKADSWGGPANCDAALVVIPPSLCSGDWGNSRKVDAISAAFNCVDLSTPRVALVLGESVDSDYYETVNQFLAACIPTDAEEFPVVFPNAISEAALEGSLMTSLRSLISAFTVEYPPLIEQVSVLKMACKCISDTLWRSPGTSCLPSAVAALSELEKALAHTGQEVADTWSGWPADDFAGERGLVRDYFGEGVHLPTSWSSTVFQDTGKSKMMDLHQSLQAESVAETVGQLLSKAPFNVEEECVEMLGRRQYRKCLQRALEFVALNDDTTIYLPKGIADEIVDESIKRVLGDAGLLLNGDDQDENEDDVDDDEAPTRPQTIALDVVETSGDDDEAIDDAGVFQKARDIFEISRTISPVPPPGGALTPSPQSGIRATPGTLSPPPGVSSGTKRSWIGMADDDDNNDDGMESSPLRSPQEYKYPGSIPGSATKRARDASYSSSATTPTIRSRDEIESSAFTRKLQALLKGEATVDMDIGSTTLARLVRDTPLLDGTNNVEDLELSYISRGEL